MSAELTTLLKRLNRNDAGTDIDLSDQNLRDIDLLALAEAVSENATVMRLDLSGNRISDLGISYLIDALLKNETLAICPQPTARTGGSCNQIGGYLQRPKPTLEFNSEAVQPVCCSSKSIV